MKVSFFQNIAGSFINKHPKIMIRLGNWETNQLKDKLIDLQIDKPIYVTGLARSGTTILLEKLASHPDLVSYRYKDFPLVHIPVWWERFLKRASSSNVKSVERTHKDRIKITPDSPEAMEEILWMSFFKDIHDTTKNNSLNKNTINNDFVDFYINNIKKILFSRNGNRYIAKGNYNISRVEYINTVFPNAKFVVAIRNPVDHIASLMKQHTLFCKLEHDDKKVLSYMQTLGHFEFGLDRRPINFGNSEITSEIQNHLNNGENIIGLAKYWSVLHSYVADLLENEKLNTNIFLIDYDDFCKKPLNTLRNLYAHCDLTMDESTIANQAKTISSPKYYKHNFTKDEIDLINKETDTTLKRFELVKNQF